MAVTRRPNVIQHAAAGDASTENMKVWALVWNGSSTAGDDLACKNTAGTVLLALKSNGTQNQVLYWPFGYDVMINGLETDVLDAGTVEYILA
jgi:hypothetical protein